MGFRRHDTKDCWLLCLAPAHFNRSGFIDRQMDVLPFYLDNFRIS
jgi:hypothetical protein